MAPSGRRLCRLKCEELDNSVDISSHQPQPSPEIQRLENGHEHQASMQWQWSWPIFVRKGLTKLHQCSSLYNKNIDWWLHASLPSSPCHRLRWCPQCPNVPTQLSESVYWDQFTSRLARAGAGVGGAPVSHLPVTHPTAAPGSLTPPGVETRPGQVQKYEGGGCLY